MSGDTIPNGSVSDGDSMPVSVGDSVVSSLYNDQDADLFKVHLEGGKHYEFNVFGQAFKHDFLSEMMLPILVMN